MKSTNKIRPLALALIRLDDKLLVFKAKDKIKKEEFYRPLGGGIEFGEKSEDALKRELKEEINADITNIKFITVLENIFVYEDIKMHEILFLFKAEFSDQSFYKKNNIPIIDSKHGRLAEWVSVDKLKQGIIYPEGIEGYI